MTLKTALGLTLALVGLPFAAAAQDYEAKLVSKGQLTIGTTGSSPPSTMYDDTAELVGLDIDLSKKLAADLGLEPEFVVLDWASMLAGVQAGRFDMVASSVSRTPERVASADFIVSQPYVANGVGGVVHKDNAAIKGWEDACHAKTGIVKGAVQINTVKAKLGEGCLTEVAEYPGWTELLLDLQNKRIDLAVGNYITPAYLVNATDRPFRMIEETMAVSGNALVVQKGNPELAAKIDALLTSYIADGSLTQLTEKWLGKGISLDQIAK
ncbi:ABC transporter substrate-binding protein [Frigidibacter sp. MR17.14]|uniref:substrate-binding periplasmic protein n=1 Tax=Frigidibacter sp. MR17.14 TaxID=3126509 RepID=UPI003012EC77